MSQPVHLDFGDGAGAQAGYGQWVPHSYLYDGIFRVDGTDVKGRAGSAVVTVTGVAAPPGHVTLTVAPDPASPLAVQATVESSNGGMLTVAWGDGDSTNTPSGTTVGHVYSGGGDYTITATDSTNGTDSSIYSIPVAVLATATITIQQPFELWLNTSQSLDTVIAGDTGSAPGSMVRLMWQINGADQYTFQYSSSITGFTDVTPDSATPTLAVVSGVDTFDIEPDFSGDAAFDVFGPSDAPAPANGTATVYLLDANGAVLASDSTTITIHPEYIVARGATAGAPGVYTPAGAVLPDPADFQITGAGAIAATPTTLWPAGDYVPASDGSTFYWSGTAWVQGRSPGPPIAATTAVAGVPGGYQPTGATVPATGAAIATLAASPTTKWINGQYVQAANGDQRYWDGTSWITGVAPALPPPPTGANAGTPGGFTPSNAAVPATGADITPLTASPSSRWPTGTWVQAVNGDQRWWDGSAWQTGQAPAPPAPASGASAGTPGSWTPAGCVVPNYSALSPAIVASPATAWATGQYVTTADNIKVYWTGSAWQPGTAPAPYVPIVVGAVTPVPLTSSYQGSLTIAGRGFTGVTEVRLWGVSNIYSLPFTVSSDGLIVAQVASGTVAATLTLFSSTDQSNDFPIATGTWDATSYWDQTVWS